MKVTPLGDRLLIRRAETDKQSDGGLWLPEVTQRPPAEGTILKLGNGVCNQELKVGKSVIFGKYAGIEISVDSEVNGRKVRTPYFLLREENVIAILDRDGEMESPAKYNDSEQSILQSASEESARLEKQIHELSAIG